VAFALALRRRPSVRAPGVVLDVNSVVGSRNSLVAPEVPPVRSVVASNGAFVNSTVASVMQPARVSSIPAVRRKLRVNILASLNCDRGIEVYLRDTTHESRAALGRALVPSILLLPLAVTLEDPD